MHVLSCFKLGDAPLHVFVARPAGYGKSVLIKALYQILARICETRRSNPDKLIVLLAAPGGKMACAVHGITAHATFPLPLSQSGNKMLELSVDVAETISSYFLNVKAIMIDDISVHGAQQFYNIHHSLQQIFRRNKNFGGLSIILFGSFRKLSPHGGIHFLCCIF
jgi:hypothetical protein